MRTKGRETYRLLVCVGLTRTDNLSFMTRDTDLLMLPYDSAEFRNLSLISWCIQIWYIRKLNFKVGYVLLLGLLQKWIRSRENYVSGATVSSIFYKLLLSEQSKDELNNCCSLEKSSVVWLDAQKCKPDCSFTSFCYMWWLTALERKSSFRACKCKCAYYHWGKGGKKNCMHYLFLVWVHFHSDTNPYGLLWEGTLSPWHTSHSFWPQKPHLIISRTCLQMHAFADCALLHHVTLTWSNVVQKIALLK